MNTICPLFDAASLNLFCDTENATNNNYNARICYGTDRFVSFDAVVESLLLWSCSKWYFTLYESVLFVLRLARERFYYSKEFQRPSMAFMGLIFILFKYASGFWRSWLLNIALWKGGQDEQTHEIRMQINGLFGALAHSLNNRDNFIFRKTSSLELSTTEKNCVGFRRYMHSMFGRADE